MRDKKVAEILRAGECVIDGAGHETGASVLVREGALLSDCAACQERISAMQLGRVLQLEVLNHQ